MTEPEARLRGRPRDAHTHEAILEATRSLLLERGYHALTIDAVARRAGTAKTSIYRRWPSRGALVLAAAADNVRIGTVPDTGSTRGDLEAAVRQLVNVFSDRITAIVMLAVIAGLDDDPTLSRQFRQETVGPWRESAAAAIQRGIDRGDLPAETDVTFALDVIVGTVFQRTVIIPYPSTAGIERTITALFLGP